jgi:hypothetical protein
LSTTTIGERERAARRGVDPERARLRDALHAAVVAAAGRGIPAWEREMQTRGVLYRANVATTGRISGYSVSLPGWTDAAGNQIWLRASQVDRRLSWNRIHKPLEDPHAATSKERRTDRTRTMTRKPATRAVPTHTQRQAPADRGRD